MQYQRKPKINFSAIVISAVVSLVSLFAGLWLFSSSDEDNPLISSLYIGGICLFTALITLISIYVFNNIFAVERSVLPPFFSVANILIVLAIFIIGAGGEALYSLSFKTRSVKTGEKTEKVTSTVSENADIVLLIDKSGSLKTVNTLMANACNSVIDGLSENCRMGGGAFADTVSFSKLHKLDKSGKKAIKSAIANSYVGDGTDFEPAIKEAYHELENNSSEDRHRIVIVFTDGGFFYLSESCKKIMKKISDSDIEVYAIRPDYGSYYGISDSCNEDFLDLVTDNGKHKERDFLIPVNNNNPDLNKVIKALNEISEKNETRTVTKPIYKKKTSLSFTKGNVIYDNVNSPNILRVAMRTLVFFMLVCCMQLLFFRGIELSSLPVSIAFAAVASGLCILGNKSELMILNAFICAITIFTLYSRMNSDSM